MIKTRFIDRQTAILIVVANMIGTGVFTTLGLQAAGVADGSALLLLWLIGGLIALCGALSYAELAAALPRSGGEYHFLSRIYHPWLGQLAGWVSVTVGFAAPVALAAMAVGHYTVTLVPVSARTVAVTILILMTAVHAFDLVLGRRVQVIATWLKVVVILISVVSLLFLAWERPWPVISACLFLGLGWLVVRILGHATDHSMSG